MLALALSLSLLASSTPQVEKTALFQEPPAQVMALPPELRLRLQREVIAKSTSPRDRFDRLINLFHGSNGLDLAYKGDATQTVAQTYASRSANCLSFTMIFVALAREAGLDAQPQEIRKTLIWRQDGGILYRVNHINTVVRFNGSMQVVDVLQNAVTPLENPEPISDRRLLAHYYNNLAMDYLDQRQLDHAQQYMEQALKLDPDHADNWSNAGVLHMYMKDYVSARRAFSRALEIDPKDISSLTNMISLAERQGDMPLARELRERLEHLQEIDPLYHFLQAELDEQSGDYPNAITHYHRAIRLHGNEPRFYDALARTYLKAGDHASALGALRQAARWSTGSERSGYRQKLESLQVK